MTTSAIQFRKFRQASAKAALAATLATTLAALPVAAASTEGESLVFGVVPQQSATRLAQIWIPMLSALGNAAKVKIQFATAKDIPTFEACLAKGAYDLAYMNPYHFTIFNQAGAYRAVARQTDKLLRGVVVVRKDSAYNELDDLQSMPLAFPSPAAFGASVIPRAEMRRRGLSISPVYVKSHDSVYRAVAAGLFPAGGGVLRTLGNIPDDLRGQLRILYKTNGYTPHAFAAHTSMPEDIITRVRQAMSAMTSGSILRPLGMKGFQDADDGDWDDVRALNLTKDLTEIVTDNSLKCHSG